MIEPDLFSAQYFLQKANFVPHKFVCLLLKKSSKLSPIYAEGANILHIETASLLKVKTPFTKIFKLVIPGKVKLTVTSIWLPRRLTCMLNQNILCNTIIIKSTLQQECCVTISWLPQTSLVSQTDLDISIKKYACHRLDLMQL